MPGEPSSNSRWLKVHDVKSIPADHRSYATLEVLFNRVKKERTRYLGELLRNTWRRRVCTWRQITMRERIPNRTNDWCDFASLSAYALAHNPRKIWIPGSITNRIKKSALVIRLSYCHETFTA